MRLRQMIGLTVKKTGSRKIYEEGIFHFTPQKETIKCKSLKIAPAFLFTFQAQYKPETLKFTRKGLLGFDLTEHIHTYNTNRHQTDTGIPLGG